MMASAAEVKGHKKSSKGKLRGRFLLSRPSFDTSALQQGHSVQGHPSNKQGHVSHLQLSPQTDADSGGGGGGGDDRDSASGGAANKSSRTKFLFRSKSEDRMRNTRIQQLPTPPPTTAPAPTPAAAAAAPTSTMQHYYATRTIGPTQTPRSPPPSYGSTSSSAGGAAGAQVTIKKVNLCKLSIINLISKELCSLHQLINSSRVPNKAPHGRRPTPKPPTPPPEQTE